MRPAGLRAGTTRSGNQSHVVVAGHGVEGRGVPRVQTPISSTPAHPQWMRGGRDKFVGTPCAWSNLRHKKVEFPRFVPLASALPRSPSCDPSDESIRRGVSFVFAAPRWFRRRPRDWREFVRRRATRVRPLPARRQRPRPRMRCRRVSLLCSPSARNIKSSMPNCRRSMSSSFNLLSAGAGAYRSAEVANGGQALAHAANAPVQAFLGGGSASGAAAASSAAGTVADGRRALRRSSRSPSTLYDDGDVGW
jgi:hypothetical protein